MENLEAPLPKPRVDVGLPSDTTKRPVPLPRFKIPGNNSERKPTDILRSIGSVSKQFSEDVATKVQNSAKSANEKIEKTLTDGSKFAKDTFERTLSTSRAVRDSVTKSVIEGTRNGLKIKKQKKNAVIESLDHKTDSQRSFSLPYEEIKYFDNIQFNSPLQEQKKFSMHSEFHEKPTLHLNNPQFDDLSLFSTNSDFGMDSVSNFSYDSKENDVEPSCHDNEQVTYDTPCSSKTNSVVSMPSSSSGPELRKHENKMEVMKHNSMYENWILPGTLPVEAEPISRPSKSTIYEFDPLKPSPSGRFDGVSNELLLLESFLNGDNYGSMIVPDGIDEMCSLDGYNESEYFNPPLPPERTDSLLDTDCPSAAEQTTVSNKDSNSNWYLNNTSDIKPEIAKSSGTSVMQRFSHILKFDNVRQKSSKPINNQVEVVPRPPINNLFVPFFSGIITRISGGVEDLFKNTQSRYCVLSEQKLMCYTDPTNSVLKEAYTLNSICSVQIVLPLSSSSNGNFCLELSVNPGSSRSAPRKVLFSCSSASERRNWAQKLADHLTNGFQPRHTAEYTRCGWCFLKEGVSSEWQGAWVMLVRRVLVYYTVSQKDAKTVDLRKTRCVVTQAADEETIQTCPTDGSSNLLLDCPNVTLYFRFPHEKELKGWRELIKLAAHNNGAYIHHQQLTKEDVPTIVDKCISFIYAHGSLTEGIYRRAGSSSVLSELLARFRRDAWSVQLSPTTHSEHDVAGVLKRFFRDLPDPLIQQELHPMLAAAQSIEDDASRFAKYREVMDLLPLVARHTARKLFAHLHFLHTMAHANKMGAENLASVWAPTIMPAALTSNTLQTAWSAQEVYVVRDLIANYESVWEPSETEKRRETAVRRVLSRVLSNSLTTTPKAAGDLKAWVYVHDKNTCYQVTLTPNKRSEDICVELYEKANKETHLLMLEEVICGDSMRRMIHKDEIVLDVVLRWSYWDDEDRKDNYLIIKDNKMLQDIEALKSSTALVCGSLKFANETNKAFKSHMFEFKDKKLCYYKDKQGSHCVDEWNIKDIIWYIGHEPKRNPQSRWAITYIPKDGKKIRCKERPWFGCTIAGSVNEDQLKWVAAMMVAQHATILPEPRLVIT